MTDYADLEKRLREPVGDADLDKLAQRLLNERHEAAGAIRDLTRKLEEAERVIECCDFALNEFADEPVDTRTALTEREEILLATRKETNAYMRRLSRDTSGQDDANGSEG